MQHSIGTIIAGSLTEGLTMRLAPGADLEEIKTGKFVAIAGVRYTFFCLITDIKLAISKPEILLNPPQQHERLLQELICEQDAYAVAQLRPMLMLDKEQNALPVKTVPGHFAPVCQADAQAIEAIFGKETGPEGSYFVIGTPLDMHTPLCINLDKLTERSNGVFGKTGTGKTFITRLVLAGLLRQKKTSLLIFDMHSEYGLQARTEQPGQPFVKGLRNLFGTQVAICSLDPAATRRRGASPDITLHIPFSAVHVDDILCLQQELNLHPTALEAAYLLHLKYGKEWLATLLENGSKIKELSQELGAHPESLSALYRKLKRIEQLSFMVKETDQKFSVIDQLMELLTTGTSVIIEFGNFSSTLSYLLVANIITRRIHSEYVERTEKFLGSHRPEDEPHKLLICIEEAHKFLNPTAARQTIFGTIAREMRKYYVSLLIVDQRPSGIDPEILSQIGTKIIAQLHDERDIQAILAGTPGAHDLKTVLASLSSKKQALVIGHAITMPVVIETRSYDQEFYKALQLPTAAISSSKALELF